MTGMDDRQREFLFELLETPSPTGFEAAGQRVWVDYVEAFARWLTDIDEYFDMPVGTYSQGMRGRLSLALLLALDFDIYLIDEGMPASTDVEFNQKAGTILRQRLETATVIVVSHQPETLEKFCRTAAVLRHGKLHLFDTLEEAKQLYDYEPQG